MDNIILYALKEGLTPAIIVVIYLLIVKLIDSKREKANIKITNELVSAINKISNLTRKYNKKYNEYLRKINELNKIIDEKDKLIVKLLSKKR